MWLFLVLMIVAMLVVLKYRDGLSNYWLVFKQDEVQRFAAVHSMFRNSARMFRYQFGPVQMLGTCHPDVIKQILSHPDCIERPFFYRLTGLEAGLLSAKYIHWKVQRRALNPTFNLRILNSFIPTFELSTRDMIDELKMLEDGTTVNILHYISKCTLNMVFGTTIGTNILDRQENKNEFLGYIERLMAIVAKRMLSVHLYPNWIYRFTSDYKEDRMLRKICEDKADEIVEIRRNTIEQNKNTTNNNESQSIFIDLLLSEATEAQFTDREIKHNAYTIILGGNETSALSVSHACVFLAQHPEVQQKVHSEIVQVLPDGSAPVSSDSLKQLVYMDKVIKETLRLCPVIPTISREAIRDIQVDGQRIRKGSIVVVSLYSLHRRRDFWGDAVNEFNPENFEPERVQERHPFAYLPFSRTPRNCIGGQYAMISMKIMLIHLLRQFKLSTQLRKQDLRYKFDITLKLAGEHLVRLERRQ